MSQYDRRIATTSDATILHMLKLEEMEQREAPNATRDSCAETLMYYGLPPRAPAPSPYARGRDLPRRQLGPRARHHEAQVRREERAGVAPLLGRDAAGRTAAPGGGLRGCRKVC